MGHTVSASRRASNAMRTRVADLAGWHLAVDCGTSQCARGRVYDLRALERAHPGLLLGEAVRRMRCQACGRWPASAALVPWDQELKRRGRVPVVGPGSC